MAFNLQDFVDGPNLDKVQSCRKDDLLSIAAHFDIAVSRYSVKKEIKAKLIEKLVELQVLEVPGNPYSSGDEGSLDNGSLAEPKTPKEEY